MKDRMTKPAVFAASLCAAALLLSQSRSFTGEIMDNQCAGMGSHARMMAGLGAKNARDCAQRCVHELGGKFTLFDASAGTVYQLDNQDKAAAFAGQKVTVKGTLDASSKTIHMESIEGR
jgi:hypothetical protein